MPTLVADDFNRADAATLNTSSSGHVWAQLTDNWSIASNVAHPPNVAGGNRYATLNAGQQDVTVDVTIIPESGVSNDCGMTARFLDADHHIFFTVVNVGGDWLTRVFQNSGSGYSGLTSLLNPVPWLPNNDFRPFRMRLVLSGLSGEGFISTQDDLTDFQSVGAWSGTLDASLTHTSYGMVGNDADGTGFENFEVFTTDVEGSLSAALVFSAPMSGVIQVEGQLVAGLDFSAPMSGSGGETVEGQLSSAIGFNAPMRGIASQPPSPSFDDRAYIIGNALIDCVCSKLALSEAGCPARRCIMPGLEADWLNCCDPGGQLTANVISITPSVNFPVTEPGPANCLTPYEVITYELQVIRCAPVVGNTSGPSCEVLTAKARDVLSDMAAMRAGVRCCLQDEESILEVASIPYFRWAFGEHITLGPEGGCVGSSLQVSVGIPICYECE